MANSCLVVNSAFQPLGAISFEEAICLIVQNKAWASIEDRSRPFRSQKLTIYAPLVLVLGHYVEPEGFQYKPKQLTNPNLFSRDKHTCQYCGRHAKEIDSTEKLTRDHIVPLIKGGPDKWENVTTACSTCNFQKGDKNLQDTGFVLNSRPKIPITWVIRGKAKLSSQQIRYAEEFLGLTRNQTDDRTD
jgi:5-methylcytosine-specific restriction endonuclease McrA